MRMRVKIIGLALLLLPLAARAQYQPWAVQWLQHAFNAKAGREYLGITNLLPGANVTFTLTSTNTYLINAGGGGGLIQLTGDVLGGPGVSPLATTLKLTGTAGTYVKTTFDAYGRETSGLTTIGNADLANSSVTYNGKTVALGASATLDLDSADFVNQGTTTTLLHGNAAGNPSWGAVDLANDVSGNLGVSHLDSGTGAGATTYWCGNGTWAVPPGGSPDIRPLYNIFTQTNEFRTNVIVGGRLHGGLGPVVGLGNFGSSFFRIRQSNGGGGPFNTGANLILMNSVDDINGVALQCADDSGAYLQALELRGNNVNLESPSAAIRFLIGNSEAGRFGVYSGLLVGLTSQQYQSPGVIMANKVIAALDYIRAQKGLMITKDSWDHSGDTGWILGDAFYNGDNFYASSNGTPYVIAKSMTGTLTTNPVIYVLPPYVLTNQWSNGPVVLWTNLTVRDTMVATNGILVLMSNTTDVASVAVTTNLHFYCLNGTNQVVTLPNAANVPQRLFRFSSTNAYGSFIINSAGAGQTIRNGIGLAYTNVGVGEVGLVSDGGNWWLASKGKTIFPAAQFSCSTNIALTSAGVAYPVTFNSVDFNFSQGISLQLGTNGLHSKMRITNPGIYEFGPSIVEKFTGNHTIRYWFRSNGVNVANSSTSIKAQNNDVHVVTVPFVISVAQQSDFEIWAMSSVGNDELVFEAAGGVAPDNYPLSPSVICPVKRISDPWP